MVERLFLAMPQGCLQFVIVVFPDNTHLIFLFVTTLEVFGLVLTHVGHYQYFSVSQI